MKTSIRPLRSIFLLGALAFLAGVHTARSQGTIFTYQGRLADGGSPVTGNYDLQFTMWDSAEDGLQIGAPVTVAPLPVTNGLFSVPLNFGAGIFTGPARWLQIESRVFGGGAYSTISPRQPLTAAPYAITAGNLTGTLPAAQLSGAVADGNLSPNVALLNRNPQTFSGQNNFNSSVGIGTTTPGAVLDVFGTRTISSIRDGVVNIGDTAAFHLTLDNNELHARNGTNSADLFLNDFGGNVYIADSTISAESGGNVGIGTTTPTEKLHVAGRFLRVDGAGGEVAYLGGDGAGSDIQVGSLNSGVGNVALYNATLGTYMNLVAQDVNYFGLQNKLDVADNFTATVRAADLTLGHSSRRGSPGRALVDFGTALYVNFAGDWADTIINSRLTVAASDMFIGRSKTGRFFGANGFDFNPTAAGTDGLVIEQGFTGGFESSGFYFDGDSISMWSPGDNNRLLRLYDEDGMEERFYISGSGQAVANGVVLTSSRRFKEHVGPISSALDKVLRLQGVTFDWVKDRGGKPGIGFIAEDLAEVLPALVEWEENGKDAVGVQYANVTAVTVEAIKELKAEKDQEIESLKKRNAELESRLAKLEAMENARETRLTALEKSLQQQAGHAQEGGFRNGSGQ